MSSSRILKSDDEEELDQETVVKDVGYKASPYHKKARDLLSSLGLSPTKPKLTTDEILDQLRIIVIKNDLEQLTIKRSILFLEEHFDQTLDGSLKPLIKKKLSEFVAKKLNGSLVTKPKPKVDVEETVKKEDNEEETVKKEDSPKKKKTKPIIKPKNEEKDSKNKEPYNPFKPDRSGMIDTRGETTEGIPLIFPKAVATKSGHSFLIELNKPNKGEDEKSLDLSGDTGAVGRISVIAQDGHRFTDSPAKIKSQKKKDILFKKRYKKGSSLRIDLKGDIYDGILTNTAVTACVVSVAGQEATVRGVYNRYIQATFQKNVMQNIHGVMVQGDVDVSKFTFSGDIDVNKEPAEKKSDEAKKGNKRKATSTSSKSKKKMKV